jgi:hypothetical protein
MVDYHPPVDQLLRRGDPWTRTWPDYLQNGINADDVDDLIRMATDDELARAPLDSTQVWAPLHAWRALGQLRAARAIEPLLELLTQCASRDDDWGLEELPIVFARIGPSALPALSTYLADASRPLHSRMAVATALECLAHDHHTARSSCVDMLANFVRKSQWLDSALGGFLSAALRELESLEHGPVLEEAFVGN